MVTFNCMLTTVSLVCKLHIVIFAPIILSMVLRYYDASKTFTLLFEPSCRQLLGILMALKHTSPFLSKNKYIFIYATNDGHDIYM